MSRQGKARDRRAPRVALVEQGFEAVEQRCLVRVGAQALDQPERATVRRLGKRALKVIQADRTQSQPAVQRCVIRPTGRQLNADQHGVAVTFQDNFIVVLEDEHLF